MRVLQLLPELNEGGIERGVVELNRELSKRGIESFVISMGGKLAEQINADGGRHIRLDVCKKNPLTLPFRFLKLKNVLRKIQPDVVHARSRLPAWMAYYACKSLNIPFITTVHGLNSVSRYSSIMTRGKIVITVSEVVRNYIIENYHTDPSKIRVIQRGVDTDFFNPDNIDEQFITEIKQQYNLDDKYIVSSIGRITWLKDFETFIKAIALSKGEIPNIIGFIVGGTRSNKTEYLKSLLTLAKNEGVEDEIIFTGSQANIREIYSLSNLTVNASLKMGNIGRTVTESLAMNTPVIATTYEGLRNLVEDGINGFLVNTKDPEDLSDKIRKAYHHDFQDIRNSINPEYTLSKMVENTINVYEQVT